MYQLWSAWIAVLLLFNKSLHRKSYTLILWNALLIVIVPAKLNYEILTSRLNAPLVLYYLQHYILATLAEVVFKLIKVQRKTYTTNAIPLCDQKCHYRCFHNCLSLPNRLSLFKSRWDWSRCIPYFWLKLRCSLALRLSLFMLKRKVILRLTL